jgi:hypothetical protein
MPALIRISWVLFTVLLYATLAAGAQAQTRLPENAEQKRRLIEQKIRLIETLVNSPAARSAAGASDSEVPALIERSREALATAKAALTENRLDQASQVADEALKSAGSASRRLAAQGAGLPDSAQRRNFQDLSGQIAAYRASVAELAHDARLSGAAQRLLARMDVLIKESQMLADSGRLGDANKKLAETYKLTVEEISRLRAGQEIVLALKFDTPADEFAYEQRRFNSNEIMVDMMLNEGRAQGDRRKLVDSLVTQGRKLKEQADSQAKSGNYQDAVLLMEQASVQLDRALRALGMPVY